MRKAVVWGVVLMCLMILIAGSGVTAQRTLVTEAAVTTRPTQVEVTNFPAVQAVSGNVNVGNLPAVQNVAGSVQVGNLPAVQTVTGTVGVSNLPAVQEVSGNVQVGNLPLDADGNLKVAIPSMRQIKFIGLTQTTYQYPSLDLLAMSRDCNAQFAGSRLCEALDVLRSIPPAPAWGNPPIAAWIFGDPPGSIDRCIFFNGEVGGCSYDRGLLPAACCGY